MALVGAGTTYWALQGAGGSGGPELSARYDPERGDPGATAVIPSAVKPAELPAVDDCGAVRTWSHAQGGTDVGASPLSLSMVGNGHTVVVEQAPGQDTVGTQRPAESRRHQEPARGEALSAYRAPS
ncbi:hypothetical protein ACWDRR_19750 [Kitasatospora sp. NPDC003701]